MASRRPAAVLGLVALLLTLLPTTGLAGPASLDFVPPTGQTAVKGGDTIGLSGSADADADVRDETLIALDASGTELARYSGVRGVVQNDGGNLSGAFILGCGSIPGCLSGDAALRARVDSYRLDAVAVSAAGSVPVSAGPIEFDEIQPEIVTYARTAANLFEVRFSEDVVEPDGDQPLDWTVDGLRQVVRVTEVGDRRVLQTSGVFGPDETPLVRYEAQLSPGRGVTNLPYVDEARNTLLGRGRGQRAADRIPPAPPTIESIDGVETTRDGNDQAEPVLSNDATPTVTISDMIDGHTARLFLDDGDGTLEDDRDTVIGDAVASGTTATIEWPASLALPDGEYRLFARAYDAALCDPNVPAAGSCPNASARSDDALYDLDTGAPVLDDPAFASTSGVTVRFSEIVTGPTTASDWSIRNPDGTAGPAVTDVSGQGDSRVLSAAGVVPDSTLSYAPSGARFVDDHGNELADVTVAVVAAPFPVLRLVDGAALEKNGPVGFDPTYSENEVAIGLELSDPPRLGETAEVTLRVVDDTAVAGTDYTSPDASDLTFTFTGSQTSATLLVELRGDTLDEFDETFLVEVVDSNDAVIVADDDAIGTITDDDALVQLSVADASATEGAVATVTATIRNDAGDAISSGKEVVADWSLRPVADAPGVHPASEGVDYPAASGTLRIAPGSTSTTVDLSTIQDAIDEFDETFELVIGQVTNAEVADGTAVVTILDDDDSPSLSIADLTTFEGETTRTEQLTVTLSEASGREVTVNVATADGTATFADGDYTPTNETLTFPPGSRTAIVDVEVVGDVRPEGDETFTVGLSSPNSATISDGSATVTLLEDDGGLPPIGLTVTGAEVMEDVGGPLGTLFPGQISWTFELSRAASGPIRINYETTDDGTATIGVDVDDKRGTLEIPAGETVGTVATNITDDDLDEDDETVALLVQDPVGAELRAEDGTPTAPLISFATIVDDEDLPTIAFAEGSETEVVTEGQDATFTVELSEVSGRDVTVAWEVVLDGTADASDVPEDSGVVTVEAGDRTATFVVSTLDDDLEESDETATIELSDPFAADLATNRPVRSRLTIADDEIPLPTLSVTPGAGGEARSLSSPLGPTPVPFELTLDEATTRDVSVVYSTGSGGTATAGQDFTPVSDRAVIPAGDTSLTVLVPVAQDDLDEFDETVELVLRDPQRVRLEGGVDRLSSLGTIVDDDVLAAVSVEDAEVDEGEPATVVVSLDTPSGKDIQVRYATDDGVGSATDGDDYASTVGIVDIAAGETSASFTIPTFDDGEDEPDESVSISISVVDDETATVDDGTATLTIIDNDVVVTGDPVVSLSGARVDEGDPLPIPGVTPPTVLEFTVELSEPADGLVEISYETVEGSAAAGSDFTAVTGTAQIADGESSTTVPVDVTPDLVDEFDEDFQLRLTSVVGNAQLPGGQPLVRTGRITDDDDVAVLAFTEASLDVGVTEGGAVSLLVERTGDTEKPITVRWATSYDGLASPADAPEQSGVLEFSPDVDTRTIRIETTQDELDEPSEAFSVVLSSPSNASLDPAADVASVTITDDDRVVPVLSFTGGTVDEGAAGSVGPPAGAPLVRLTAFIEEALVFTGQLDEAADENVLVDYTTVAAGTATAGSDFVATSGTLEIPAGDTFGDIEVDVEDDQLDEFTETVVIELSNPRGARFDTGAATLRVSATITDDDPVVEASIGEDVTVVEGDPATFDVTLSALSGKDVTVRVTTTDGSATAPSDFASVAQTFEIKAGQRSRSVTVQTRNDSTPEPTEDLTVNLAIVEDDTADLGRSVAVLTITDDDAVDPVDPDAVVVSLTGASVEEGDPFFLPVPVPGPTLDFTVSLSAPADGDVVVDYTTRAGTATAGEDFEPVTGSVTIPDGESEATVPVTVVPDSLDEPDETLQLVLTAVSGDAVLPGGSEQARVGRILDDDPAAALRAADDTVLEGDTAVVTVTLDQVSGRDVTVAYELAPGTAGVDDYEDVSGTLSFPAGTTSQVVEIPTTVDGTTELIEQFELVLSSPVNAELDDARATVTIVDLAGGQTAVFLEDLEVTETDRDVIAEVPVLLSSERDDDTVVTWSSQQLTATDGEDYVAEGGQVVIPAGATSARIPVTIVGDDEVELREDFLVLLTEADGAIITGPTGRVTILDDDSDDDGDGDGGGGGTDPDGGTPGGSGTDGDGDLGAPDVDAGELPATGGGAALLGLAAVAGAAALRRRRDDT